jgi:hypothetical protein
VKRTTIYIRPGLLGGYHVVSSLSRVTERQIYEVQLPYGIARWRLDQHVHLCRHQLRKSPRLTQLLNGQSTSTFAYDANGNVTNGKSAGVPRALLGRGSDGKRPVLVNLSRSRVSICIKLLTAFDFCGLSPLILRFQSSQGIRREK